MKNTYSKLNFLLAILILLSFTAGKAQTVTDIDGNVYNTVTIGTQVWLKENLKVTHYRNGDAIPNVTDDTAWSNLTTGAYCWYYNDAATYANTYGALYNWHTVADSRNMCPTGWHVATHSEWNIMEKYLDNTVDTNVAGWSGTDIGGKLKEADTLHWNSPNTGATNSSGFTALPGGIRVNDGTFDYVGRCGNWCSATENGATSAWAPRLYYHDSMIYRGSYNKSYGFSIRCVRDLSTAIIDIDNSYRINIYPNPSSTYTTIQFPNPNNEKNTLTIYNADGQIVQKIKNITGTEVKVESRNLENGLYFF
ncbi:MAG: FISUMP domain-containing protein, partial [Bacteroidota bacterium]